jgi:hypothetical protein
MHGASCPFPYTRLCGVELSYRIITRRRVNSKSPNAILRHTDLSQAHIRILYFAVNTCLSLTELKSVLQM